MGLTGLGIGAGARAFTGINSLLNTKGPGVPMTSSVPTTIRIPSLVSQQSQLGNDPDNEMQKAAVHPLNNWWGIPAAAATAAVGVGTGWKAIDWLMQQRKKSLLQRQLTDAQDEFNTSIKDQYTAAMGAKTAADAGNPLPELDELFDLVVACCGEHEKQAEDDSLIMRGLSAITPDAVKNTANTAAGVYLTAALGTGALGAYGMYNWTKNRNKEKVLRQAMEMRARQRMGPQPVYAMPVPLT